MLIALINGCRTRLRDRIVVSGACIKSLDGIVVYFTVYMVMCMYYVYIRLNNILFIPYDCCYALTIHA